MFKVGDKVKVLQSSPYRGGETGIIIKANTKDEYDCHVKFDANITPDWCPFYKMELELLIKVGEQLEFDFMKGL